jgi:hypothetical protein
MRLFGKHALAPIDNPRKVLDIGTGKLRGLRSWRLCAADLASNRDWHLGHRVWSVTATLRSLALFAKVYPANEHPESDVLGTDLSPIQPE